MKRDRYAYTSAPRIPADEKRIYQHPAPPSPFGFPLDHVPITPSPRKYILRGLKRGLIAAVSAGATIGIVMLFPFVIVSIPVLLAFWWLICRFYAL